MVDGAVRGGDRGGNGQAKPGTGAGAGGVGAAEPFEGVWEELGRKSRPVVTHPDLHQSVNRAGDQLDRRVAVAHSVVDEVADRAFHAYRVDLNGQSGWTVD